MDEENLPSNPFGEVALSNGSDLATNSQAREQSEMQAQVFLAKQYPRKEAESYERIMKPCKRPGFAEGAIYSFPRGGARISGPSVNLVRELARSWGNIRYGVRVVAMTGDSMHIKGFAHDFESNAYVEEEVKFPKKVLRKGGRWVETEDERDLRELKNKHGAIAVRNCLLQLLPKDVVDDAMAACQKTLQKAAAGELEQDREQTLRRLVLAFSHYGVDAKMIEELLGYEIGRIDDKALAGLREIYTSIKDGHTSREEHFNLAPTKSGRTSDLEDELKEKEKKNGRRRKETNAENSGDQEAGEAT